MIQKGKPWNFGDFPRMSKRYEVRKFNTYCARTWIPRCPLWLREAQKAEARKALSVLRR